MAQNNDASGTNSTQQSFVESPYEDSSWEVIGEVTDSGEFLPMEIETIPAVDGRTVDPMFADYGGFTSTGEKKRWHLPEHLSGSVRADDADEVEDTEDRVALTEQEIAKIKADAAEQGKNAGFEAAEQANIKRQAEMEKRITGVLQDFSKQLKENLAATERSAVDLALAISQKIVGFAVEINPEYIIPVVNESLGLAGGATIRKVRVSPQDMEFIEIVGVAKNMKAFDGTWQFEKDDSIRSGCIVETSAGQVDSQLDVAWERIKESVVKSLA